MVSGESKHILCCSHVPDQANEREELTTSYRWTSWVWEITDWSWRLREKYWSFRGMYGVYFNITKENRKITTRAWVRENQWLVTGELVEFEKYPVEVGDFGRVTDHFRGIYRRVYLKMNESKTGRCQHVTSWI